MTTATFIRRGGVLLGFDVQGHTGYASLGSDIVCSAISTATHMTYLGLSQVLDLKVNVQADDAAGGMKLTVSDPDTQMAQAMLEMLERELRAIAKQYPKYLIITYRERREFKCFS